MQYMFQAGFLGTRAPYFMDIVTIIVALLPLIVYASVLLAKKKYFKSHMLTQNIIYVVSIIVVAYFEVGVRVGGGFDVFMATTEVSYSYALLVLIVHIIIAITMLIFWTQTIIYANYNYIKKELPGKHSINHRLLAIKSTLGIILTSFTGVWVYLLLFVY